MRQESAFEISQFKNPSGEVVFRVTGWLDCKRIRKNFRTHEEAVAERQVLDVQRLQSEGGAVRTAITRLNDAQLREAEAAFARLEGQRQPLAFYLEFGLTNYRAPESEKKLVEAIKEYVAQKEHEREQDLLSVSQLGRIRRDLKRFKTFVGEVTVAELTGPRLIAFFELGRPSLKTYNNRRGIVSTFIKFAFVKGWIRENIVLRIPAHRIRRRRGGKITLTAERAAEIMAFLETFEDGRWVPFFALTLFAGIRPAVPEGEICRLKPADVNLKEGKISISAEVSKVREPRWITIHPNLDAWLRAYPLEKFPLIVPDFQRRRAALGKELGLSHDVLRHTFISMFVAKFRSIGEAALQAGNSESIIRRHYLELKSAAEAEEFYGIMPKKPAEVAALPAAQPSLGLARESRVVFSSTQNIRAA